MDELNGLHVATFFVWLVASVSFILALKFLASPRTARTGNLLGAAGMAVVVAWTFFIRDGELGIADTWWIIIVGALVGAVAGWLGAKRVPMTAMPQMVAIFNGAGGGAAALVAVVEFLRDTDLHPGELLPLAFVIATLLGAIIGSVSLTGSIVAWGKLQGVISGRPVKYPGSQFVTAGLFLALLVVGVYLAAVEPTVPLFLLFVGLALILGVQLTMPIGGADMPVVVSLLNSYTGIAVAATGFVLSNYALLIAGTLVGASGAILTQLMCKAMNRSLFNVLFAGFGTGGDTVAAGAEGEEQLREISAEDAAVLMAYGKRVIIVPGYGMAVAQAQGPVRRGSHAGAHERPPGGGERAVRPAPGDGRDQRRLRRYGRRARHRRQRRRQPGRPRGGLADQRHADPQRRPGAEHHRPQARPRRRLRGDPEPAVQQREDEDAVR
jgi:NAD(P) transhydrogenase subunit beta